MTTEFDSLIESWLPKAERWIEQERGAAIESLIVEFVRSDSDADKNERGWPQLPAKLRQHFDSCSKCSYRLDDDQFMSFGYRGDLSGWRELFGEIDKSCRPIIKLKPSEHMDRLRSLDRWTLTLFHLGRAGVFDRSHGGQPMNLNPEFQMSVGGAIIRDARFSIDSVFGKSLADLRQALLESATRDGWYAHFHDIRLATVATIRWLQTKRAQALNSENLSLPELLNEILIGLNEGVEFEQLYPLLRRVESLRVFCLGGSSWPGCLIDLKDGFFRIVTKHPYRDEHIEAEWDASVPLSPTESKELRQHIESVVRAWLRLAERRTKKTYQTTAAENQDAEPLPSTVTEQTPPPPFAATADWMMSQDLAQILNKNSTQMSDARKAAKVDAEDEHGRWGVDSIGTFRRAVDGKHVAYYLPELAPRSRNRFAHARKSVGDS